MEQSFGDTVNVEFGEPRLADNVIRGHIRFEQGQANLLVRAMLLLWRSGVERIFWYTLKDDPNNPYGLVAEGSVG